MLDRSGLRRLALSPVAIGAFFLIFAAAVAAPACAAYTAFRLGDGAVVDPVRAVAFIAQPQGGIEALDLSTGKAVWRSASAAKPLALLAGGALLAQDEPGADGTLRLALLDPATGAEKGRTDFALPEGVRASVVDDLRGTFRVRAAVAPDTQEVLLAWTATATPPLHGFLPPDISRVPVPVAALAAVAAPAAPVATGLRRGAARLDFVDGDLATGKATPADDTEADSIALAIDRSLAPGAEVELTTGAAAPGLLSIDRRHALASERVAGTLHTFRWSVSLVETGAVVAVLDAPVSLAPFVVVGANVIYIAQPSARRAPSGMLRRPLRLQALDLSTGAEAWQAVVRDAAYGGPVPP